MKRYNVLKVALKLNDFHILLHDMEVAHRFWADNEKGALVCEEYCWRWHHIIREKFRKQVIDHIQSEQP